jgi:hypothetical protein
MMSIVDLNSHTRELLLSIKANLTVAKFKNQRQFVKSFLRKKSSILKYKKIHRSGWQKKLKCKRPSKMTVPSLFTTNVRSLLNKIDDLQLLLNTRFYSNNCVFLVQETWLNNNVCSELLSFDGYLCFRQDRSNSMRTKGGGVATFINQLWCNNIQTIFQYSKNNIDCICTLCKPKFLSGFSGIIITNVYIPPSMSPIFLSEFYDEVTSLIGPLLCDHLCLFAGDFNRCNTSALISLGLIDVVDFTTRCEAQLDHIFTNRSDIFATRKQAPLGLSDHCIIRLLPKIYSKSHHKVFVQCKQQKIKRRDTSQINIQNLRTMISTTDFDLFLDLDHETLVDTVTEYLKFCYDVCCPLETVIIYPDRISSVHLKQMRRKKEVAYKCGNRTEVRRLNLLIKQEVGHLNKMFTEDIFRHKTPAEIWKGINRLTGKRKCNVNYPTNLNNLNESFVYKPSDFLEELKLPILNNGGFYPLNTHETLGILRKVRCLSSSGSDGLSPAIFNYCSAELAKPLTTVLNRIFSIGKVPLSWKSSKIIPVPKPKVHLQEQKFRPIACTSIFLKVAEQCIINRIKPAISTVSDIFQFAYKARRSTLDAVAYLHHLISSSLDSGCRQFKCVFLDFSSAFNTFNRQSIIDKLSLLEIPNWIIRWIFDYFSNCSQFVFANGKCSDPLLNNFGVLQGAVLSPIFFSLHTASLQSANENIIIKYADDTVIAGQLKSINDSSKLQSSVSEVDHWSKENGLLLNKSKCIECVFKLRSLPTNPVNSPVVLDGIPVKSDPSVKYLGVYFSSDCSWSNHIQEKFSKLLRLSFVLRRFTILHVPHEILTRFVDACVLPVILYCSPVIFPGLLAKDFTVLRRSVKIISRASGIVFQTLTHTIATRHIESSRKFAERILSDDSHQLFPALSSSRSLRNSRNNFTHIFARTNHYKNSTVPFLARVLTNSALEIEKFKRCLDNYME